MRNATTSGMAQNITFKEWQHLVLAGKTKGVYFALLSFATYVVLILYNRNNLLDFIGIEVGSFASFGVLVDLVSHLLYDNYQSGLTMDEWISRIRHGRTHDVYGLIVQAGSSAFALREFPLAVLLWISLLFEFYYIRKARFYH